MRSVVQKIVSFFWGDSDAFERAALALWATFGLVALALIELLLLSSPKVFFDVFGVLSLTALLYFPAISFLFAPLLRLGQRSPLAARILGALSLLLGLLLLWQAKTPTLSALSFVALYMASALIVAPHQGSTNALQKFAFVFLLHLLSAALFISRYGASFATRASIIKESKIARASTAFSGRLLGAFNYGIKELADEPEVAKLPPSQITSKNIKYRSMNGTGEATARNGRWLFTLNFTPQYAELYDLEADPAALQNVIDEHRDVAAALTRELLSEFIQ